MDFNQVIPFNTSKGGTTPDLCLENVAEGFGIGNKYGTAWEAWLHTQQHPNQGIPAGLDVPLYYSYTTTIDNVTQNYGHINVQLRNGTVWSDGTIYQSIADYESKKFPRFVGWGESVNDYKIIEGDNVSIDKTQVPILLAFCWHGEPISQADIDKLDALNDWNQIIPLVLGDQRASAWMAQLQSQATPTKLEPGTYIV